MNEMPLLWWCRMAALLAAAFLPVMFALDAFLNMGDDDAPR